MAAVGAIRCDTNKQGEFMDSILLPLLVLAAWFALQVWVLPRLGVPT
jgi:hypothetical protein